MCWYSRWAFGKYIGHKGGTHMNGISALIEEAPENLLASFTM